MMKMVPMFTKMNAQTEEPFKTTLVGYHLHTIKHTFEMYSSNDF